MVARDNPAATPRRPRQSAWGWCSGRVGISPGRFDMVRLRSVSGIAVIVLVAWVIGGCATGTGGGTVRSVTAADGPMLAGVWQGYMAGTTGSSFPATLTVKPDGSYTVQGGAVTAEGQAIPM